jgi:calcineurin-like phosphoesterase family protein
MIWFTADTHFNHANIIRFSTRPFDNVLEMNETLIDNWNRLVKPIDSVYHLGDFGFGEIGHIIKRLNGKKYLTWGSHDKSIIPYKNLFVEIRQILEVENIILCHYSMRVWARSHYGSWHLYGHSHGKLESWGKSFDVGVDCWNFKPLSLEQVKKEMNKRQDNFNLIHNLAGEKK